MAEYLYTEDHEWVLREENRVRVGISDFAQGELGDIAYVELPEIGKEVKKGEAVCSIDSLKSSSEIYAPVSGKVVEVNEKLRKEENCEIINKDPLGEGWIFVLEMSNPEELEKLMSEDQYNKMVEEE